MREFSGAGLRAQALAEASYKPPVAGEHRKTFLTLSEVHELTGISTKTLAVMCKSGELPALRKAIGSSTRTWLRPLEREIMPNYKGRKPGTRRITIFHKGRQKEWVIEGTKAQGDLFESQKRLELEQEPTEPPPLQDATLSEALKGLC